MPLDIDRLIGAVRREVSTRDIDGKEARVVTASRRYDTTVEDLWEALTDPERLKRWFLPVSGEFRIGGRYRIEGNASGVIQRCEPPRTLGVTWEFQDNVSWVTLTLASAGGGTELRLEHAAHVPEEFQAQFGDGATGVGWDQALMGLEMHLVAGPVRPENAEEWVRTPEGKDFVTRSSEAWYAASVAAGTDSVAARAAADRTTAFYLGIAPDAATD